MGSWTALLVAYLLGGVTLIPLVGLAVLIHAHYAFPYRNDRENSHDDDDDDIVQPGDDTLLLDEARRSKPADEAKARAAHDLDVTAGYFAVCREYVPMGLNAKPIERATPLGSTTVAAPSPSVYQTMYRSIFDRKPVAGPLDGNGTNGSMSQRPKKAGNVFYVVLRHGHLMLFDDDEQLEVRHVISLAHYDISIYSGGDVTPEGELFIKRNALCLSRKVGGRSDKLALDGHVSKPFYLFSENCSAKEDFYFSLLKNQEQTFGFDSNAPIPKGFEVKNIISLVQRLHSSEDHVHSRWLNAMLGRIFLAVYRTKDLENTIREKITKKISRVKRPSFLANITIQKIDTGEAAPLFTNLKLKDLTVEGECLVEADVRYTGNFRIEVGATAKIDLGSRFKAREVTLLLAVVLKRIEGHVLFKVKAPPSNRLWMSFQTMPKMEMAIEPIVSSRQITYTLILRQIENRIKEVFAETLVQPFWDDVPFFRTEHKTWRGGIFQDDDAVETSRPVEAASADNDAQPLERPEEDQDVPNEAHLVERSHTHHTHHSPVKAQQASTGLFGKLGRSANGSATSILSASTGCKPASSATGLSRSLNIVRNATDPVVGTETAHADLYKPSSSPPDHATNLMASLASRSQDASPVHSPVGSFAKAQLGGHLRRRSSSSSRETESRGNTEDSERASNSIPKGRRNTASSAESVARSEDSASASSARPATSSFKSHTSSLGRSFFAKRESGNSSSSEAVLAGGELKKTTLAAVTNAAEHARQWGWNAIRRQKEQHRNGDKACQIDLSRPMGRGQPLPPPGTPLPGPVNGAAILGSTVARRKTAATATGSIPEKVSLENDKSDEESRASQPPRLPPRRRRRGASQQQEEDVEQNMLVVAAPPDESPPGTPGAPGAPAADAERDRDEAWVNTGRKKLAIASQPGLEVDPEPEPLVQALAASVSTTLSQSLSNSVQGAPQSPFSPKVKAAKGGPLIAVPASIVVGVVGVCDDDDDGDDGGDGGGDDDDEDLSGWLQDTDLGNE